MNLDYNSEGNVRSEILVPFVNETITALDSMAGLKGTSDLLSKRDPLNVFTFKGFAVCVVAKIDGEIEGKVVMNHSLETAMAIGNKVRNKMLGTDDFISELNEDICEALTEFSNTAIGLATRHLDSKKQRISFNSPLTIVNQQDSDFLMDGVVEILTIPIDIEDVGRFYFSYLLHHKVV